MASFTQPAQPLLRPSLPSIEFLHPGYPETKNCILRLERVDNAPRADADAAETDAQGQQFPSHTYGVHYGTALVACQIVAANAFGGRLALDAAGGQPVHLPLDAVLIADKYYFFANLDRTDDKYPIVPSFADCQGQSCILTRFRTTINQAHLVPRQESTWFDNNKMQRYVSGAYPTMHQGANIVPMRADLHMAFDRRMFVVLPKQKQAGGPVQFVGHILDAAAAEYMPTVHNIAVDNENLSASLLFARFAWAIIMRVKIFVLQGPDRVVHVLAKEKQSANDASLFTTKTITGAKLQQEYGGGGSPTSTPRKRKWDGGVDDGVDDGMDDGIYGVSDDDSEYSDQPCPRWIQNADGSLTSVRHENLVVGRVEQGITPQLAPTLEELQEAAAGVATQETGKDDT